MSMLTWAEKEIELACAREGDCEYGIACYKSAMKAFESLLDDEHSGFSIGITKNILVRLIEGKPLTPIEDTPDIWGECSYTREDGAKVYQCKRMSSLFKDVHPDGRVTYSDVQRVRVTYTDSDIAWSSSMATRLINEMFPITMPYVPAETYILYAEEFLVDPANGDFDTLGYMYAKTSTGERIEINRFFKEGPEDWIEIDKAEYEQRKAAKKE